MKCKKCGGNMEEGKALVPIWGRSDGRPARHGDTLNQVSSKISKVIKCKECGHSFKS